MRSMLSILMTCQPFSDWIGPTIAPSAAPQAAAAIRALVTDVNCSRVCAPREMSAALKPAGAAEAAKALPQRIR